jgi:hypothetical protein
MGTMADKVYIFVSIYLHTTYCTSGTQIHFVPKCGGDILLNIVLVLL